MPNLISSAEATGIVWGCAGSVWKFNSATTNPAYTSAAAVWLYPCSQLDLNTNDSNCTFSASTHWYTGLQYSKCATHSKVSYLLLRGRRGGVKWWNVQQKSKYYNKWTLAVAKYTTVNREGNVGNFSSQQISLTCPVLQFSVEATARLKYLCCPYEPKRRYWWGTDKTGI